jgi:hypothetical protein
MKYIIYPLLFLIVIITQCSCRGKVVGDVHIYGTIRDAYDNTPIPNVDLRLYKDGRSVNTEVNPELNMDSARAQYDMKLFTNEKVKGGYWFEWEPLTQREYYFGPGEIRGSRNINGNDCPIDITLKRTGYMTVRMIDVFPFDFLPYPEFYCDGNEFPVQLFNYDGDTTFTVKLVPDGDNFYELVSRSNNFTDTIITGIINMNLSGDTLYQTLQY